MKPRCHRIWPTAAVAFLLVSLLPRLAGQERPAAPAATPAVHYTVHAKDATAEDGVITLEVTVRHAGPSGDGTVFAIPVWTPGSYRLRDFPERLTILGAEADGKAVTPQQLNRTSWLVPHSKVDTAALRYRVAMHPTDRFMNSDADRRCLTYEGPAVYMYVRDGIHLPCHVRFDLPDGWSQASGLTALSDTTWFAADYDVLADCPVKIGRFQTFTFESHGSRIEVVLDASADQTFDHEKWLAGLKAIVDEGGDIFGGLPVDRYAFLYTLARSGGGGGLEHLNSTAIGLSLAMFRRSPTSAYGVSAHEFFHVWNVKRLRPIELGPFHYDRPNRTTGLWLSEGITSYYGDVLQARAGLRPAEHFWRQQGQAIARLESMPGRHHVSSEQASFRVWDIQAPDRRVDYYTSGQVLGLLLDLQIRHHTENARSLDDAMKAMWQFCEQNGRGLRSEEIVRIASDTAGADLAPFFAAHVAGTLVPDYATILGYAGFSYAADPQTNTVLRGVTSRRGGKLTFTDLDALELSGRLPQTGTVETVDGQPVASMDDVDKLVAAALAENQTRLLVGYTNASGQSLKTMAAIEQPTRLRVTLEPLPDRSALQQAIAAGIPRPRD